MNDDVVPRPKRQPVLKLPDGKRVALGPGQSPKARRRRELDVCFVFDTTGSMADKIDGLIQCMDSLVRELGRLALDWRVTTVPFGDLTIPGDEVVADKPFVNDVQSAVQQLRSMPRFYGGGNTGESSVEAMLAATRKPYRPGAVKVLILITDEPALGYQQGAPAVASALRALDALCFTVAPDLDYYRRWAREHGGEWHAVRAAVDTSAIIRLFTSLLAEAVAVATKVIESGGSVRGYLERGNPST